MCSTRAGSSAKWLPKELRREGPPFHEQLSFGDAVDDPASLSEAKPAPIDSSRSDNAMPVADHIPASLGPRLLRHFENTCTMTPRCEPLRVGPATPRRSPPCMRRLCRARHHPPPPPRTIRGRLVRLSSHASRRYIKDVAQRMQGTKIQFICTGATHTGSSLAWANKKKEAPRSLG